MESALYVGRVVHVRTDATPHRFGARVFMTWLDLDELDLVFRNRWFWSTRRWNLACFERSDYLGDSGVPLAAAVKERVRSAHGFTPAGPVRMLTNLRTFGVCFNPVTFYFCFDASKTRIQAIVAEITNTPWNERHAYVLDARDDARVEWCFRFAKEFHVSPFIGMDCSYVWTFTNPGESLRVHMQNVRGDATLFTATFEATRVAITTRSLAVALVRFAALPLRVLATIYWQALRLWWKGAPFFAHPARRTRSVGSARRPAAGVGNQRGMSR